MKLFWAANTISPACAVALNEGGIHWESVEIDFKAAEQTSPAYLAINPKGRVPSLSTPEGILTETGAILEYIGATFAPELVPADPLHAARMRELMYYITTTMHANHAHRLRGYRWAREEASFQDMQSMVTGNMASGCEFLEERITGPFFFGDQLTLAECWVYPVLCFLPGDGVEIGDYPKLSALKAAMDARPSVKAVLEIGMVK
ncbi:MAG: glutathione S-transferase family protein [Boseongicola sp.]